jgi:two-component system sensor histidine kinase KdpD
VRLGYEPALGPRRQLTGLGLAAAGLPLLTLILDNATSALSLEGQVLLYLLAVVLVSVVGGMIVAVLAAVGAALLINFFFVEPLDTLDIARADQAVALVVFIAVAAIVSGTVEVSARRAAAAEQAAAQAETLAALAGADLDTDETLRGVLEQARQDFGMQFVALRARDHESGVWHDIERAGEPSPNADQPRQFDVPAGDLRLVGHGPSAVPEDDPLLQAFAAAAQMAYDGRRLTEQAKEGRTLAVVDRQRTSLLAAVGHDLRTPLAAIKAAASSLRQRDIEWSSEDREELLATIERSADRLAAVVANLLDASRLQAGAFSVHAQPVALDEVVGTAILALPEAGSRVDVQVAENLPLVMADPGLLERVIVNLLDNALRYGGTEVPVEVRAFVGSETVKLEIVDHGPGVPPGQRDKLFEPFQRLDDRSTVSGIGLGLSVARGFTEAMGGALVADRTLGGGLLMRLRLPLATAPGLSPSPVAEALEPAADIPR